MVVRNLNFLSRFCVTAFQLNLQGYLLLIVTHCSVESTEQERQDSVIRLPELDRFICGTVVSRVMYYKWFVVKVCWQRLGTESEAAGRCFD